MTPAFITRSYGKCDDDQGGAFADLGDQCWKTSDGSLVEDLNISMNGRSSRLVRIGTSDRFRLYDDPGWRVERVEDLIANKQPFSDGAEDHERWVVTTPEGVRYYFGSRWQSTSAGGSGSTWTMPVFGNHDGEPCYEESLAQGWCWQGWRWNLDRVVDPHGNATVYSYEAETNYYDLYNGSSDQNRQIYHRGGVLSKIEYGFRTNTPDAPNGTIGSPRQVIKVASVPRCVDRLTDPSDTGTCTAAPDSEPGAYPDVPTDLICTSGVSCPVVGPSFFSTNRYWQVRTSTRQGTGGGTTVDAATYELIHLLPDPDVFDGQPNGPEQADLWLSEVKQTGHVGGASTSIPNVFFGGVHRPNRVKPVGDVTLEKWRVFAVRNELGGRIDVTYGHAQEAGGSTPRTCTPTFVDATTRWGSDRECFAQVKDNGSLEWFHKYVVTRVAQSDDALHYRSGTQSSTPNLGQAQIEEYDYAGTPAWRYTSSPNVPTDDESWTDWRGYEEAVVRTLKTTDQVASGTWSRARTVRFRGMNRSKRNATGDLWSERRISTIEEDGEAPGPLDERWLNGLTAETDIRYANDDLIERTYTGYDWFTATSEGTEYLSKIVYPANTNTTTRVTSGANPFLRQHKVAYRVETGGADHQGVLAGVVNAVEDQGAPADGGADDRCTTTTWDKNADLWTRAPGITTLHASDCGPSGPNGSTPTGVVWARSENFYDNEEDTSTNPLTLGDVTKVSEDTAVGPGNVPVTTETDYDIYGRVVEVRDPRGNRTLTDYNPAGTPGGAGNDDLVARVEVTQVQDDTADAPELVTVTDIEPAMGLSTQVTDPNGGQTRMTYDGLGRPRKVFFPTNTNTLSGSASIEHTYTNDLRSDEGQPTSLDQPARVKTSSLQTFPSGPRVETYAFYDGWGRAVQTQSYSPTAGRRLLNSTGYDDRGLQSLTTADYSGVNGDNYTNLANPDPTQLARYSLTTYDAAARPTTVTDRNLTSTYRTETSSYFGDRSRTIAPGSGAITTLTDRWDRTTRVELATDAAGTTVADSANYTYTPADQMATITKPLPAGTATWTYTYDLAGRRTKTVDPDTAITTNTYDPTGNLTTAETYAATATYGVPGALQSRITHTYDDLNRPRTRQDTTDPSQPQDLAAWTYDNPDPALNGLGRPSSTVTITHSPALTDISGASWKFTEAVTGYDDDGNTKGNTTTYPTWLTGEQGGQPCPGQGSVQCVTDTVTSTYNHMGQVATTQHPSVPGQDPSVAGQTAPLVSSAYDPGGRLTFMSTATGQTSIGLANIAYNAIGQTSTMATGTSGAYLSRSYTWEPTTGRLSQLTGNEYSTGGTNQLTRLTLLHEYDVADNLQRSTASYQAVSAGAFKTASWCYDYDGLNRLTRAFNGVASTVQDCTKPTSAQAPTVTDVTGPLHDLGYTYSWDRLATVRSPAAGTATGTAIYQWGNATKPHQTSNIAESGNITGVPGMPKKGTIGYDPQGRAKTQPGQFGGSATNTYDTQDNLVRTVNGLFSTTTNAYNADGIRIARRTTAGASTVTSVYLANTEITKTTTAAATSTHNFATPDGTPLMAFESASTTPTGTWLMADISNTLRLTRDPAGATRLNYYPFGEPTAPAGNLAPDTPSLRGYLNKTHDAGGDLRLDHRTYTPNLNILTAPDPLLTPADPQTLNPYSYGRNNPLTLSDPSGLEPNPAVNPDYDGPVGFDRPTYQWGNDYSTPNTTPDGEAICYFNCDPSSDPLSPNLAQLGIGTATFLAGLSCGVVSGGLLAAACGGGVGAIGSAAITAAEPGDQSASDIGISGVIGFGLGFLPTRLLRVRPGPTGVAANAGGKVPQVLRVGDVKLSAVPKGAVGTPTQTGKGLEYAIPRGTPELAENVASVRIMNPVTSGKYQYPNGYAVYQNAAGQTINPLTGRTIANSDPFAHLPLP